MVDPPDKIACTPRFFAWLAFIVLALGLGLRLYRIGQPDLWGDEILYLLMCQPGMTAKQVIDTHLDGYATVSHLPAVAVLCNLGMRLQGLHSIAEITPGAARLPSVVMALATMLALAAWIYRMRGSAAHGLLALAVMASSYIHIWYSREAYHYPGLVMFQSLVLLSAFEVLRRPTNGLARLSWFAAYGIFSLGLTYSHPSGSAFVAVMGTYLLVVTLIGDRKSAPAYGMVLVAFALVFSFLRFDAIRPDNPTGHVRPLGQLGIEALDLVELFIAGPGWCRGIVSLLALGLGAFAIGRREGLRLRLLLVTFFLLFFVIWFGGRSFSYRPRYFLLLWPLLVWVASSGLHFLVMQMRPNWQRAGLIGVVLLAFVNTASGLRMVYPLESKHDMHETMRDFVDEELAPGTIALWDGGHALRFMPYFYTPKTPMLFGAIPDASVEAYAQGRVQRSLQQLQSEFPAVAYLQWADPPQRSELFEMFPLSHVVKDENLHRLIRSGWFPDNIPRLTKDYDKRIQARLNFAALHVFYTKPDAAGGILRPVFAPQSWRLVFDEGGTPLLQGTAQATVDLWADPAPNAKTSTLTLGVLGLQPGTLRLAVNGTEVGAIDFEEQGDLRQGQFAGLPCAPGRIAMSFTGRDETAPRPYALTKFSITRDP